MPFETSPLRLWKSLDRADREAAARAFWQHPPQEVAPMAALEIVKLLRVRPQAFAKISLTSRVRALAGLAHPPDAVAEALVVALHVEDRRPLLAEFLDALGIANEDGMIAEETEVTPPAVEAVRAAATKLRSTHEAAAIRIYWNALWLQDPERWAALETVATEL